MRLSAFQLRQRVAARARDGFLRAAAALTEPPTAGVLAFALLEGSIALLAIAEADVGEEAREIVERRVRAAMVAQGEMKR